MNRGMRASTRLAMAIVLVIGTAGLAFGQSAGTQRSLRNLDLALSIEVAEPFRTGTIPPGKEFEAQTLVKDLEDRLRRARGEFDRIGEADRALPAVIDAGRRLAEMERIRDLMKTAVASQGERAAQAKTMHFAFLAEFETYLPGMTTIGALARNRERDVLAGFTPERLTKLAADVAHVRTVCAARYGAIENHPTYSIPDMLNTCPGDLRRIAELGDNFLHRAVLNHVGVEAGRRIDTLREIQKSVETGNGFLASHEAGVVNDPVEFKSRMVEEARPWFAAIGREMPEGYFAPVDTLIARALAAVDSAAAHWSYPDDKYHDAGIEGVVRRQMASGVTVIRTSLTYPEPTIFKNELGIPLSRSRSGHILYRKPGARWCSLRSFDYVEEYAGGGRYAAPSRAVLSEAVRFQSER